MNPRFKKRSQKKNFLVARWGHFVKRPPTSGDLTNTLYSGRRGGSAQFLQRWVFISTGTCSDHGSGVLFCRRSVAYCSIPPRHPFPGEAPIDQIARSVVELLSALVSAWALFIFSFPACLLGLLALVFTRIYEIWERGEKVLNFWCILGLFKLFHCQKRYMYF